MDFQWNTIREFTGKLASAAPTPGGGGAAALCGALAVALGSMAGKLTAGKAQFADRESALLPLIAKADALRERLLTLIEEDAAAFAPLAQAYALPKSDPERERVMEDCLYAAAQVPMEILSLSCEVIALQEQFLPLSSRLLISDVGCGTALARAAMEAAALNVLVNSRSMKDRRRAEELNRQTDAMTSTFSLRAEQLLSQVSEALRQQK